MKIQISLFYLFICLCSISTARSQNLCKAPEIVFNKNTDNIFNETQEMYLGEAIAETLEKNFRVVKDEEANRYLQKVGAKLVEHLPPTSLKFQFHIIDTPELNAFATQRQHYDQYVYARRRLLFGRIRQKNVGDDQRQSVFRQPK